MARIFSVLALFCVALKPAAAQDMPLSQILIDGEGWTKVEDKVEKPKPLPVRVLPCVPALTYTGSTLSPDRETMFVASTSGRVVWAYRMSDENMRGAEYCLLRLKRGAKTINVTGLATDRDGRIYAATDIGVQVFDPSGRLCGVLTPAAPGKPEHMAFAGDTLTLWVGDTKYSRKLNTQGAK